jgi:hypothetical protein
MDDLDILRDEHFDPTVVPTKWDYFEVMDRTSVLMNQVSETLNNHPGFDEEQAKMAYQAFKILFDLYQTAGAKFFEFTKDEE